MATNRLISVDVARAIAIILVVSYHFDPDNSPQWYELLQLNVIVFIRMPLFMFASGYLYILIERERERRKKIVKYRDFVWHKFKRLMIPYFFVSSLIIVIKLFSQKVMYVENPVSLHAFYELFYHTNTAGYFMWFAYGLFLIFLIIPHFNSSTKLLIITAIALAIYLLPMEFPYLFSLAQLKSKFIYFCLGCLVSDRTMLRNIPTKINTLIPLFLFIALCISTFYIQPVFMKTIAGLLTSIAGVLFVLSFSEFLSKFSKKITKPLLVVAVCSYTIYLFHTTFMGFAKAMLMKLYGNMVQNDLIFIVSGLIVITTGVIGPILLHLFVAKHSKVFSFLIGTKFLGEEEKNKKQ